MTNKKNNDAKKSEVEYKDPFKDGYNNHYESTSDDKFVAINDSTKKKHKAEVVGDNPFGTDFVVKKSHSDKKVDEQDYDHSKFHSKKEETEYWQRLSDEALCDYYESGDWGVGDGCQYPHGHI